MVTEFVIATPHDAVEFNDVYRNTTGSAGYLACNNIYNRVVLNEWYESTPFPDLATHWECLDGARRWRFHLNQAARWQDGTPLTAHDVAYTHLHAKKMGYTGAMFMADVAHIEAVNDHTVDYHLRTPNRSEERRVGKECRNRRTPDHEKTKVKDMGGSPRSERAV